MQIAQKIAVLAALICGSSAWAESQSDITWPSYDQVQHVGDGLLNCAALGNEIAHVDADLTLLEHAKARVEDVLHSAFDMERYAGTRDPGGGRVPGGAVHGKEAYSAARGQIVEALKIAHQRHDWLISLKPNCKPAP